MLDERKEKAITYILEGHTITDVANSVGVVRQTIYDWLNNEEFKAELDRRRQDIVLRGNNMILNKLGNYIDTLTAIALKGKSEKSRIDASTYLVDRVLGRTTTKIETNAAGDDKNKVNDDILQAEFDEVDNDNE